MGTGAAVVKSGGLLIEAGGITITSGGLTISSVGITSAGSITVTTGSITAPSIISTGGVSASSYTTTSDGRYKTNVTSLRNRAARLLELNGVSFQWRGDSVSEKAVLASVLCSSKRLRPFSLKPFAPCTAA